MAPRFISTFLAVLMAFLLPQLAMSDPEANFGWLQRFGFGGQPERRPQEPSLGEPPPGSSCAYKSRQIPNVEEIQTGFNLLIGFPSGTPEKFMCTQLLKGSIEHLCRQNGMELYVPKRPEMRGRLCHMRFVLRDYQAQGNIDCVEEALACFFPGKEEFCVRALLPS